MSKPPFSVSTCVIPIVFLPKEQVYILLDQSSHLKEYPFTAEELTEALASLAIDPLETTLRFYHSTLAPYIFPQKSIDGVSYTCIVIAVTSDSAWSLIPYVHDLSTTTTGNPSPETKPLSEVKAIQLRKASTKPQKKKKGLFGW
jgi:hypothetical protein